MTVPPKLRDLAISDTGFLFDPHTGSTFSINETGLAILQGLRRGDEREALLDDLRERFEVPPGTDLERDLDELLHLLRRNGLVPESWAP
ncbi:MAG: HPr-rel-A system PqqD family peptide chaperone [Myxococcales bacterium]|nr:HPr-rel-A system PqqD family peptide chaperone [Myxococcales bacterium]